MEKLFCTELLIGKEKLRRIRAGFVTVIGLGAVGSYAAEALARIGVGRLRLVDFDSIKMTNFNRNILTLESTLGMPKVAAARARIAGINPSCRIEAIELFAASDTFGEIFKEKPDLVIDAIDALTPKIQLLTYCHANGIPVFSSMGAATRTETSSVKVGDLFKSHGCPLAREIRRRLRRNGIQRGIFCVYSTESARKIPKIANDEENDYQRGRKRNKLGSLPTIPGIFGLTLAHHAAAHLCGGF